MANKTIAEIDNFNDRCILTLLSLKKELSLKDKVYKWFIGMGIPNPEYRRSEILFSLRKQKLLDYDMKASKIDANKSYKQGILLIGERSKFMFINRSGEKAIYGRIFKSENKRRFNIIWQSIVGILVAVITALITNKLSKCP